MPNGLISILAAMGVVGAVALILAATQKDRFNWGWLAAAFALMIGHDALLTQGWGLIPLPDIGETWNWTGKLLALAGSLAVAALPMIGWRRVGVILAHNRSGLRDALILSGVIVVVFTGLAVMFGGEGGDAETFAFQTSMPGLEEELFYRGLLLLAFNEAFARPVRVVGAPMGWAAVLTSLAFGLDHALGYGSNGFSFDAMTLALTGGPALLLVWLRERTGSLLLPVLLHNYANTVFMVV